MLIFALIVFQLIIFFLLIFILRKIILQNVTSATRHLEELNKDYQEKQRQIEERLKETEQKAQQIINQAKEEAEKLKAQIIQETEQQRDQMINEARQQSKEIIEQAERSRHALISEIEQRIEREAIDKAADLIKDVLPPDFKLSVHNLWIEELMDEGFSGIDRLNIPEDINEVEVISAFALSDTQKKDISKKLKEILKRDIQIKEKIDPEVVAGIIINLGSLVLDGSLKFKIKDTAKGKVDGRTG
jgi:F-type H+-transporting ATPase subunit b